jgi:hypothetical protein
VVIDQVSLELKRTGKTAKFVCQGRPYDLEMKTTLIELEHLALYLVSEVGLWRDEQIETEGFAARI